MINNVEIYSVTKHTKNKGSFEIQCPLKYSAPENGIECVQEKCAWWMPIQKACAINVNARILDTKREF